MKTCKEMTEAVLAQAKQRRTQRNRRITTAISVCACCMVLFVAAAFGFDSGRTERSAASHEPRLVLMCSASEYSEQKEMVQGVGTPMKYRIYVKDLRELKLQEDDGKLALLMAEERRKLRVSESEADDVFGSNGVTQHGDENGFITVVRDGFLYVKVDDITQVRDTYATTTGAGSVSLGSNSYRQLTESGEEEIKQGITIFWGLSNETVDKILEEPDIDLSFISDTVTVSVVFTDGTTENMVLDIGVDSDGVVHVTNRETTVS